jgi:hypothetical protein
MVGWVFLIVYCVGIIWLRVHNARKLIYKFISFGVDHTITSLLK